MQKRTHIIIDIIIGILVVIAIVLVDHLFVAWRSSPAEEIWPKEQQAEEPAVELQAITGKTFLPILNFHRIDKAPAGADRVTKSYYIEPEKFEAIIKDIIANDYEPVFVSQAVNYLENRQMPQKQILAITFDDGNEDFYANAWPILQKYKIKSSMYIMTGVGGPNYLTKEQILELDASGLVEIGSHTVWHPNLTKISETEQRRELKDSKEYLEKLLKKDIEIICYPFGNYNDQVKKIAREIGYKAGLTYDQDAWQNPEDLMALTRISIYPELNIIKFLERINNGK